MAKKKFLNENGEQIWPITRTDCVYVPNGSQTVIDYIDDQIASHGTHLNLGVNSNNAYYGDKGAIAYNHSQTAHAPSNAQKNSDITKVEIENKLTGTISSHMHDYITSMDTRNVNDAPNTYTTSGIFPEFKSTSTIGLPNVGKNFAGVVTYQQWGDTTSWSGGKATQFATIDDGRMYFRKGEGTSWGAWNQFYTNLHKPELSELGAAPAGHSHKYAASESYGGGASGVKLTTDTSNRLYLMGSTLSSGDSITCRTSGNTYMSGNNLCGKFIKVGPDVASSGARASMGYWTDKNIGYVSVGYSNSEMTNPDGLFYMSPHLQNNICTGARLTLTKLNANNADDPYTSDLLFNKDGTMTIASDIDSFNGVDSKYLLNVYGGAAVQCLRTRNIRPETTGTYNLGNYNARYKNLYVDTVSTTNQNLQLGTLSSSGGWAEYGALYINSATGYVNPAWNGALSLGDEHKNIRFHTIALINSPNVNSDARMKTDIHYLDSQENSQIVDGRRTINMNITTDDMYDFVKNDLKLASYRYNINLDKGNTSVDYGFIAQDLLYTKVGSEIVQLADKNDLDSNLSYNQGNYINTIAGALQKEIEKRDEQIEDLQNQIINLLELVNTLI